MKKTIVLILLLASQLYGCASKELVSVSAPSGDYTGFRANNTDNFVGVPYAQPPVGELRWRSPQPITEPAAYTVTEKPSSCPQFPPMADEPTGAEDCLYLNIWRPQQESTSARPVMVWIHGGGFTAGEGAYSESDGQKLALNGDVVVVALNYRLGVFGFLADTDLTNENPDHPSSGNYGIEDQTAALRWVRDNIASFGGDPENVTIFGQSAGGVSVCAQLTSPLAAGLFHRAIIQSGPCSTPLSSLQGTSQLGVQLAEATNCNGADKLACLRALPMEEIAKVLPPDPSFAFGEGYTVWWPIRDGHVLPMHFLDAFESGQFNQVPVMNGATLDEGTLLTWLSHDMLFKKLKAEQYLDRLEYLVGSPELAAQVAERYPLDNYDKPVDALNHAFGDGFFNCMTRNASKALAQHVPTWDYEFTFQDAPFYIPFVDLKAYHAAEIQYIFQTPMSFFKRSFKGEEAKLSDNMMRYWSNFAHAGNPNGDSAAEANSSNSTPHWPHYANSQQSQILDLEISQAQNFKAQDCQFWDELPYLRAPY